MLKIEFNTDNSAFDDVSAISQIVYDVAHDIQNAPLETENDVEGVIFDTNGNRVDSWQFVRERNPTS